jgi:hypothetical protein
MRILPPKKRIDTVCLVTRALNARNDLLGMSFNPPRPRETLDVP